MATFNASRNSSEQVRHNNEVERHSTHSHSTDDSNEAADIEANPREQTLTQKGDIEAYPSGANAGQEGMWRAETAKSNRPGRIGGIMSRLSTKSSWIDPGPPPDGGRQAWIQGRECQFAARGEIVSN